MGCGCGIKKTAAKVVTPVTLSAYKAGIKAAVGRGVKLLDAVDKGWALRTERGRVNNFPNDLTKLGWSGLFYAARAAGYGDLKQLASYSEVDGAYYGFYPETNLPDAIWDTAHDIIEDEWNRIIARRRYLVKLRKDQKRRGIR